MMNKTPIYSNSMNAMSEVLTGLRKKTEHAASNLSYKDMLASMLREGISDEEEQEIAPAKAFCDMHSALLEMSSQSMPQLITTKRFMPDGTIIITTKKDGKIVEQIKKKPHLVPTPDPLTGEVKLEPFQSIFELMA